MSLGVPGDAIRAQSRRLPDSHRQLHLTGSRPSNVHTNLTPGSHHSQRAQTQVDTLMRLLGSSTHACLEDALCCYIVSIVPGHSKSPAVTPVGTSSGAARSAEVAMSRLSLGVGGMQSSLSSSGPSVPKPLKGGEDDKDMQLATALSQVDSLTAQLSACHAALASVTEERCVSVSPSPPANRCRCA